MGVIVNPIELFDIEQVERRISEWRHAHAGFDALMLRHHDAPGTLRYFGLKLWAERTIDLATEVLTAALSLSPRNPRLWTDLAGVLNAGARNGEAGACVRTALALDPSQAGAWLLLATLSADVEDFGTAEAAYGQVLALDPGLADAHFGLGILYFNQKRFAESAERLRLSIRHGNGNANGFICLGHVLYLIADFAGCAESFETAARMQPLDPSSRRKFARASMMLRLIDRKVPEALALYSAIAGPEEEDMRDVTRDAFSLLSAHDHLDAAVEVGLLRLERDPQDFVQRYLLDAVRGAPLDAAPTDYLETLFDKFAKGFDKQLVETLRYNVPAELHGLVAARSPSFEAMLDLGCGTGLAAGLLHGFGGHLTGVDLSARMLEEAGKRGVYDALIKAEAVAFLEAHPAGFDLVFAADMLVYCGDLVPFMREAARALRPGGFLALSVEAAKAGTFVLRPSGRFAHARAYIEALAERDFIVTDLTETIIRLEANRGIEGFLFVLRRR